MISLEQQVFLQIEKANNILVAFGADRSGDALASALALFLYLKKMGKRASVAAHRGDKKDELFSFLPSYGEIKENLDNLNRFVVSLNIKNTKVEQIKYVLEGDVLNFIISPKGGFFSKEDVQAASGGFQYDLIITINVPDLESLGRLYDNNVDFFYKTSIINIDHQSNNEEYGQINFVELNALATGEILYELFKNYDKKKIDADIATCLLCGLIHKTRSFKNNNLTPHALSAASDLIGLGARREEIVNKLYRSKSFEQLKLWGRVLNNLKSSTDNSLVWSKIFKNDFPGGAEPEILLAEIMEELLSSMPQAKAAAIFYSLDEMSHLETEAKDVKEPEKTFLVHNSHKKLFQSRVLLALSRNANALDLIKEYAPEGSKRLALGFIDKALKPAEVEVIEKIQNRLAKLPL